VCVPPSPLKIKKITKHKSK